jgi:hypothetical protein
MQIKTSRVAGAGLDIMLWLGRNNCTSRVAKKDV